MEPKVGAARRRTTCSVGYRVHGKVAPERKPKFTWLSHNFVFGTGAKASRTFNVSCRQFTIIEYGGGNCGLFTGYDAFILPQAAGVNTFFRQVLSVPPTVFYLLLHLCISLLQAPTQSYLEASQLMNITPIQHSFTETWPSSDHIKGYHPTSGVLACF